MVRVKQFADDLGISKNQAKNLINKGRSRKDGGSQILESVMSDKDKDKDKDKKKKKKKSKNENKTLSPFSRDRKFRTLELTEDMIGGRGRAPVLKDTEKYNPEDMIGGRGRAPVLKDMDLDPRMISRKTGGSNVMKPKKYGDGGSNKVTKLKKETTNKAKMGNFKNIINQSVAGKITPEEAEQAIKKIVLTKAGGGATDFGMLSVKAGIDNNPKATQADRIAGATKKATGGTVDMKKSSKRAESGRRPKASPSRRSPAKETLVPFKGVLKTSEGETLRNVDGKTFVVKPPKSNMQKAKKMRGGGIAIQGLGFKGIR